MNSRPLCRSRSLTARYLDILYEHGDVGEVGDFGRDVQRLRRLLTPVAEDMQGILEELLQSRLALRAEPERASFHTATQSKLNMKDDADKYGELLSESNSTESYAILNTL